MAVSCRRSNSVTLTDRQRSAARASAPNISLRTAFSPKAFGMILRRRRSSTNRRSPPGETEGHPAPGANRRSRPARHPRSCCVLEQALLAAQLIKDDGAGAQALGNIAAILAGAGRVDESLQLAQSIKDDFWRDNHTRSLSHYLGHKNLQSTAVYTALAPDRFKEFWRG
jgi:hypothetical protein